MKLRYASVLALSIAASAQAETFRVELNAGFGQGEVDGGLASVDYDAVVLGGTVYFSDVNTGSDPLREAAFLDKASGLGVTRTDLSFDGSVDSAVTTVDGRFVLANDFIIEASFNRAEDDFAEDSDTFSVGLGTYINDNSDIVATFSSSNDTDVDTLGVEYHSVIENGSAAWAIDLGASYIDTPFDSGHNLAAGATFYPNANFGIGAALDRTSVGDSDITTTIVSAEYFFNSNFAGELTYSNTDEDVIDFDLFAVGVTFRF